MGTMIISVYITSLVTTNAAGISFHPGVMACHSGVPGPEFDRLQRTPPNGIEGQPYGSRKGCFWNAFFGEKL